MSYEVTCPNGHKLRVDPSNFGKKAKCARCGIVFAVPDLPPGDLGGQQGHEVELSESGELPAAPPSPSFPPATPPSPASPRPRAAAGAGILGLNMTVAQVMLVAGLVLVLVARGCDSLGSRAIANANAQAQSAQNEFNDKWEAKMLVNTEKVEEIQGKKAPSVDDTKAIEKLREESTTMSRDMEKERTKLQRGEWRDLTRASRDANTKNQLRGYWLELLFVLGTIFLTIGLVVVGVQGEGAQRWICLMMVAIITFSVYIWGIAWVLK